MEGSLCLYNVYNPHIFNLIFFGSSFLSVILERAEVKLDIQVMFQKCKNLNPNHIDVCCPLCFLCLRSWSVAATWTTAMVWPTWRCFTTAVRLEHMELVRYLMDIDPISQSALQHLQEGNQRMSNVINRKSQEKTKINNEPILATSYHLFNQSLIELGFCSSAALKPGPYCVYRRPGSRTASQQSADLSGRRCESEEPLDQHERSALRRLLRRPGTDPSPA